MSKRIYLHFAVIFLLTGCVHNTVKIKNEFKGQLEATFALELVDQKKFVLDDNTAPQPIYSQFYYGRDGRKYFTFFNDYNNSIYLYDYDSMTFKQKITWEKEGPNGIAHLTGYHLKSLDTIYLYDQSKISIKLGNSKGKILKSISLCGGDIKDLGWFNIYPQYYPQTVTPFIETKDEILLTGFFFGSIPESIISNFKLTSRFDFDLNKLHFSFGYPPFLYGSNYNWEGELFTMVYTDLNPESDKLVISFPVSHSLYLADLNTGNYNEVYGGSNFAKSICSIGKDPKKTSKEEFLYHFMNQDVYAGIKYDKYNNVYYRFLLKSMSVTKDQLNWKKKLIAVIILDENFKYMGETVIGNGEDWHWQNSFVSKEGLNIEYVEKNYDEVFLTFKIFSIKQI